MHLPNEALGSWIRPGSAPAPASFPDESSAFSECPWVLEVLEKHRLPVDMRNVGVRYVHRTPDSQLPQRKRKHTTQQNAPQFRMPLLAHLTQRLEHLGIEPLAARVQKGLA